MRAIIDTILNNRLDAEQHFAEEGLTVEAAEDLGNALEVEVSGPAKRLRAYLMRHFQGETEMAEDAIISE